MFRVCFDQFFSKHILSSFMKVNIINLIKHYSKATTELFPFLG